MIRLQQAIEALKTEPATDLAGGLRELFGRLSRRGVLMLMSDFLVDDLEKTFASVRLFRHRRWEVVALHLVHPDEERLPAGPGLPVRRAWKTTAGSTAPRPTCGGVYQERFEAHCAVGRGIALAAGCDYRRVSTATPYLQTLRGSWSNGAGEGCVELGSHLPVRRGRAGVGAI